MWSRETREFSKPIMERRKAKLMRSRDTVNTQLKTSPPQTIFCLSVCFCRWKSIWNELKKSSFTLRWAAKIDASEMVIVLCYRGLFHVGVCFGAKYFTIIEPLFIQEYPWLPGANCSSPGQGFFQIGFLLKHFAFVELSVGGVSFARTESALKRGSFRRVPCPSIS